MSNRPRIRAALVHAVAFLAFVGCSGGGGGEAGEDPPVGAPPSEATAALATAEDTESAPVEPAVLDPDAADSGLHVFTIVTQPGRGSARVESNRLVYLPDPDFAGTDAFTFRARDPGRNSVVGTATVTVSPVNDPPSATGGGRPVLAGTTGAGRDPWVDDPGPKDVHSIRILSEPTHGTTMIAIQGILWVYTPFAGFTTGTDSFTYRVTDPAGASATATALVRVHDGAALVRCKARGVVNQDGTIQSYAWSNDCGMTGGMRTRVGGWNGASFDPTLAVTTRYIVHQPSNGSRPKAAIALIGGGDLNMAIWGDAQGVPTSPRAQNFVARTAQLFADAGYLTFTIDRPTGLPPQTGVLDDMETVDRYRVSVDHAVDVLKVAERAAKGLDLFLVSTSRGALSVVSLNLVAAGFSVSSPVTSRSNSHSEGYWVGDPRAPNALPSFVARPAHVMWHVDEECPITTAANARALYEELQALTGTASFTEMSGGAQVMASTPEVQLDPYHCGPFDYHGFLAIEPEAVASTTAWIDGQVNALAGNGRPVADFVTVRTRPGVPKRVDLSKLARDPDGDPLSHALSHTRTSLGGTVALAGNVAIYTPPAGAANRTDYFVHVATDGRGGVAAGVVTVQIGE